jgi:hypothetical protein
MHAEISGLLKLAQHREREREREREISIRAALLSSDSPVSVCSPDREAYYVDVHAHEREKTRNGGNTFDLVKQ